MAFFEPLPPTPAPSQSSAPADVRPWLQAPTDEIPVAVPLVHRLARVPGASLHLRRIDVYRAGVEIILRFDMGVEVGVDLDRTRELRDFMHPRGFRPEPARQLRIGVKLSDGSRADVSADSRAGARGLEVPGGPSLVFTGGGGGGGADRWTSEFRAWLWPLPPAGAMTLHYLFEGIGVSEGSIELDATKLREVSSGVLDAWAD